MRCLALALLLGTAVLLASGLASAADSGPAVSFIPAVISPVSRDVVDRGGGVAFRAIPVSRILETPRVYPIIPSARTVIQQ